MYFLFYVYSLIFLYLLKKKLYVRNMLMYYLQAT